MSSEWRTNRRTGAHFRKMLTTPGTPEFTDAIAEEYQRHVELARTPTQVAERIASIINDQRISVPERKMLISSLSARVAYYNLRRFAGMPEGMIMFEMFVRSPIVNDIDKAWVIERLKRDGIVGGSTMGMDL